MKKISTLFLTICICSGLSIDAKKKQSVPLQKIPVVYHPKYNMHFWGFEHFSHFDTKKYRKIYKRLRKKLGLKKEQFYMAEKISNFELELVHSPEYLESLKKPSTVASVAESYMVRLLPKTSIQSRLLDPMRYGTGGSVLATQLALQHGWSINLSGGYHHAKKDKAQYFSFFADIPLALHKIWQEHPHLKVLIVDLDAHQGNGYATILKDDERVTIFDVYNGEVFPQDMTAATYITYNFPLAGDIESQEYLNLITSELPKVLEELMQNNNKPNLIIYNAGTDVFMKDKLGGMQILKEDILERDSFVFSLARKHEIPIVMLLSGGFSKQSTEIISDSIEHIIRERIEQYYFATATFAGRNTVSLKRYPF